MSSLDIDNLVGAIDRALEEFVSSRPSDASDPLFACIPEMNAAEEGLTLPGYAAQLYIAVKQLRRDAESPKILPAKSRTLEFARDCCAARFAEQVAALKKSRRNFREPKGRDRSAIRRHGSVLVYVSKAIR